MDPAFDLLDRLDHYWKTQSGTDLAGLLKSPDGRSAPIDVRVDLCAADLEWRYRMISTGAINSTQRMANKPSPLPRASDYETLIGRDWESAAVRRQLLEAEWIARNRLGDSPDVDEFASQMPDAPSWREDLANALEWISPLQLAFHNHFEQLFQAQATANFVIGRANRQDPSPPAWNRQDKRAIVAPAKFRSLSRTQLSVRRIRLEEVELTNLSRLIPSRLHNETLMPGQVIRRHLPLTLFFPDIQVRIFCDADPEFALEKPILPITASL
jgi:hypothetical protein